MRYVTTTTMPNVFINVLLNYTLLRCAVLNMMVHLLFFTDGSLRELVLKILPLASHYSVIVRFIQEKRQMEWGRVNQALTAAMNKFVNEYLVRRIITLRVTFLDNIICDLCI